MTTEENSTHMASQQIKVSRYRYVNLILFMLAGICNSMPTQAFSAIAPIVSDVYGVSELEANMNSLIYAVMYPIVVFPVNYILEVYGLKVGTLIAELFMIAGLLLRLLVNINFYFFIAGTFVTSLGFCFMINSPNKFTITWFPVSQISIINSLCIFSIFGSDSLGAFLSALFLDENSSKQDFFQFFAIQSVIIIVILIMMAILFKGKPKNPPNYASVAPRQDYIKCLKSLFRMKNYMKLFISMTFIYGVLGIFFTSLSWQLKVYEFSSIQTGIIFVIANISGCIGCVIFSSLFGCRNYRRNCLFYLGFCIFALMIMYVAMQMEQIYLLYIGGGLFGFSIFPFLTTMTDFASQTAFPIGQALSGGSLLFGGQILGVISAIILSIYIFDGKSLFKTRIGCGIQFAMMFIGLIFVALSKEQLKRTQYEELKTDEFKQSLISQDGKFIQH